MARPRGWRRARHLAGRFLGALWPVPPAARDQAWASARLAPDLWEQWARQPAHDRRHALRVARRVEDTLAPTAYADDPRWVEAALAHDLGKLDARLGVLGRVGATLGAQIAGHDLAEIWASKQGITRRFGLYLLHPSLGAARIRLAGGSVAAATWAEAHHADDPVGASGLPVPVVAALLAADDD